MKILNAVLIVLFSVSLLYAVSTVATNADVSPWNLLSASVSGWIALLGWVVEERGCTCWMHKALAAEDELRRIKGEQ